MEASTATGTRVETHSMTLGVLSDVKKLLDIAVSRGAFRAEEMTSVGGIYDRYAAALNALLKQNEDALASQEALATTSEVVEEAGSKE